MPHIKLRIFCLVSIIAFVASLTTIASVARLTVRKTHPISPLNSMGSTDSRGSITVHAAGRGNPWINLSDGRDVKTSYTGAAALQQVREQNLARPLALASADFDEDGVPDLIGGYAGPGGGIITLQRGNVDSIYPNAPEAQQRKASGTYTDSPFLSPAHVFEVVEAADFVGTGDFDADSHWDVVAAARGGDALWLLPGDGHGSFGAARRIDLPGRVTTLVTGEINRADGLTDVVVGVVAADGPEALVFESPEGALRGRPEAYGLPAEATAMALGQLDDEYTMDLAAAAGRELMIVHGRDRKLSLDDIRQAEVPPATIERVSLPLAIKAMALGDFSGNHRTEVALLSDKGMVHLLSREEANGREQKTNGTIEKWKSNLMVAGSWPQATRLVRAKVSSIPTDDLVLIDGSDHQLHILSSELPVASGSDVKTNAASVMPARSRSHRVTASLDAEGEPVAVLPMRLNVDALSDLVILKGGSSRLTVAMTAAMTAFVVTGSGDSDDCDLSDGICNIGTFNPDTMMCETINICTLRAAIQNANASPGADRIEFAVLSVTPTSALPTITEAVTIEAGRVELSGGGLSITAGNSTVRGLVINRVNGIGIGLMTNGGNFIENNFIGTDVSGTAALGNGVGVLVSATSNTIGGTAAGARNVVSGNDGDGIQIFSGDATGNLVQGNYIGTDVNGTADLGNSGDGVHVVDSNNTIGGTAAGARNVISGNKQRLFFGGYGVEINGAATGNLVQGNFIGTDASGTAALGNAINGVLLGTPNNTIGGTAAGARNVISGNNNDGIGIGGIGSTGNLVQGNFIGIEVGGTADLGNSNRGVEISFPGSNTIGGSIAGARNVISGNGDAGIYILSESNLVQGNYIGTDVSGTDDIGNVVGVEIAFGVNNTLGGLRLGARNVISGNNGNGIVINGTGNLVQGNYIGADVNGTANLGNNGDGVLVFDLNNTIGGTAAGARNVISSNNRNGIELSIFASGNLVQGNFIGTDVSGVAALANGQNGILIRFGALSNTIGGTTSGAGNIITFNGGDGVFVESGVNNAILSNSIHSNMGLGIDLQANGVTPNDTGDGDAGANNLQNFPVLTVAASTGSISGTLNSTPNTHFTIEFFSNAGCDPSGNGEGETRIGSTTVTTDSGGDVSFNAALPTLLQSDRVITATATDPDNNTSEFSKCIPVSGTLLCQITCPPVQMVNTGPGSTQCGAIVDYPEPSTLGSCGSVTCMPQSGSFFSVGATAVNCTTEFFGASCSFTVTVVDNTPPAISCPAGTITVEPTSPVGAMVTYPTPVGTDNCPASTTIQTAGLPSGSIFPLGTTVNIFQVTDVSGTTASCSFDVKVLTPQEAIPVLIGKVQDLITAGALTQSQAIGLTSKLQAAIDALSQGKTRVACNKLKDFRDQVNGLINAGKLTPAQGQPLIDSATNIRNALSCP